MTNNDVSNEELYLAPKIHVKLLKLQKEARKLSEPTRISWNEFQVFDMSSRSYRVDLGPNGSCVCNCGKAIIYHMPYIHVIACAATVRQSHLQYFSDYYTLAQYKLTYPEGYGHFYHQITGGDLVSHEFVDTETQLMKIKSILEDIVVYVMRRVIIEARVLIGEMAGIWVPDTTELTCSITDLRGKHRAAHLDEGKLIESASHLLMVQKWPINCPRFMDALRYVGLDCVSRLQFTRMDQHLLTALVERWLSRTNTFHLPVGEMTITLQDVNMLLGLQIDGPALVGLNVVGEGRRWQSWPDCCDDLIGSHPDPDIVYYDPTNRRDHAKFKMRQAQSKTCLPLRWLRWTYRRDSYIDLNDMDFWRHVRAYVLFMIGCYLLPDTSSSEVHLRYLPLLEDVGLFSTCSFGRAVLCHLYRELALATKPHRTIVLKFIVEVLI